MGDVIKYRREPSEHRDHHDAGRVSSAWRWFSARTVRRAARYRDVAWTAIARHVVAASALIVLARIFRTEAFAPFALVAGAVWLALIVRIALIKGVDSGLRARRRTR